MLLLVLFAFGYQCSTLNKTNPKPLLKWKQYIPLWTPRCVTQGEAFFSNNFWSLMKSKCSILKNNLNDIHRPCSPLNSREQMNTPGNKFTAKHSTVTAPILMHLHSAGFCCRFSSILCSSAPLSLQPSNRTYSPKCLQILASIVLNTSIVHTNTKKK